MPAWFPDTGLRSSYAQALDRSVQLNPNAATRKKSTYGIFLFVAVAQFRGFSSEQLVEFIRIKLNALIDQVVCKIEESKWLLDYYKEFLRTNGRFPADRLTRMSRSDRIVGYTCKCFGDLRDERF